MYKGILNFEKAENYHYYVSTYVSEAWHLLSSLILWEINSWLGDLQIDHILFFKYKNSQLYVCIYK